MEPHSTVPGTVIRSDGNGMLEAIRMAARSPRRQSREGKIVKCDNSNSEEACLLTNGPRELATLVPL